MKKNLRFLKLCIEVGSILLLILILIGSINFLRVTKESSMISTGAETYPYPRIEQTQPSPILLPTPYPVPEAQPTAFIILQKNRFIGPDCLIDYSKNISLQLPKGWYGEISQNSINIMNYDPSNLEFEHGKPKNIPANNMKIEIYKLKLGLTQTLEQWVSAEKAQSTKQENKSLTVSENFPYTLGKYDGISYSITDITGWNSRIIALKVNSDEGIIVNIFPANSEALKDGLVFLSTLDSSDNPMCSEKSNSPNQVTGFPDDSTQIKNEMVATFECPTGVTFPGTEALSTIIDLQMPFLWGQTWVVGGNGSFYGNYHHCNYYNNYYASDWNRPDNNDAGFFVVSVADGTVASVDAPPCTTEHYGCYVDVDHLSGFRTRYAHLDSVLVSPGASVWAGTILGTVGQSGTNNYHLHLSFWHWDHSDYPYYYNYFSQCYNNGQTCANSESPLYPQGYRPSPMWTTYGNTYLVDGSQYTSANGKTIFLPIIISSP
jgi:hypothetical protein